MIPYDAYSRIEVSKSALLHNIALFQQETGMFVMPVLKNNAYGHGLKQVASALKGHDLPYLIVDDYLEALKLRAHTQQPILIMGMIKPYNFARLQLTGFTFVVQDESTVHALGSLKKNIKVHVELNTGMNRYGVSPSEIRSFAKLLQQYPSLQLEGVMTHLADADGMAEHTVTHAVEQFDQSVDKILATGLEPTLFHIGQSAASLRATSRYANATRLGIGFYGVNPFLPHHPLHKTCEQLRPALKLISAISKINKLSKDDKVGYNYTFTAPKAMRIGVLPLGHYEGLNRALSNKGVIKIAGGFYPIVGRVCMNHTMIDLKGGRVQVEDEAVVISDNPHDPNSILEIAKRYGVYTTLFDLSPDMHRYLIE